MIAPGTRVHLKHSHDPMYAIAQQVGIEYKEVEGRVTEQWDDQNLVEWDAGDANPWPDEALEVIG